MECAVSQGVKEGQPDMLFGGWDHDVPGEGLGEGGVPGGSGLRLVGVGIRTQEAREATGGPEPAGYLLGTRPELGDRRSLGLQRELRTKDHDLGTVWRV